jgi:Ca2+-binding RTX toxin-like protein
VGELRLGLTLVASLVLALVAAAPAMAGTASVNGGTLTYDAIAGEANTVTVTQNGSSFTVSDTSAPLTLGAGCSAGATAADAVCSGPIQTINVDLRDLNDFVDIDAQVRSFLDGQAGDDELYGGDGVDIVNGGPGTDLINVRDASRDTVQCDETDVVASFPEPTRDTVNGPCANDVAPTAALSGGPTGPTSDNTPSFTFGGAPGQDDVTGFECMIDGFDDGPFPCNPGAPQPELPDGPYFFRVRALDAQPGPGPWTGQAFSVDTQAPQVTITGPPSGNSSQLTFQISSPDPSAPVTFECAIDQDELAPCGSSYTTPPLANGTYVLFVKGTDAAGNSSTTELPFGVQVTAASGGGGGGAAPVAPVKPSKIIIESLVLISGKPVKMSRKGHVSIRLQCAGTSMCKGRMSITTAEPVKRKSRKLVKLGTVRFRIAANKSKNVKVRFSKAKRKLAKRLKRFKAKVVINEIDKRGNKRISSRVFVLRAR